jgi:hypothetical protein
MCVIYINFMLQTAVSWLRWSSVAWVKFLCCPYKSCDGWSGNRSISPNTSIFPSQYHSTSAPCSPSSKLGLTERQACMCLLNLHYKIWGLNNAAEESYLLLWYTMLTDKQLPTFQKILVPLSSGTSSLRRQCLNMKRQVLQSSTDNHLPVNMA